MAQIRESRCVVLKINGEDIDLIDLTSMMPVCVEVSHKQYTEDIEQDIQQLSEGDIMYVQLQSEDTFQPNSIWRFLNFEVIDHDSGWEIM
jgi:FKBP-type peptidyl-prolyl cis-trans isomerase 2